MRQFEKSFRDRFVKSMDREDVYEELHSRTQAPEESVASYLADVKCIVARFRIPPSTSKQLRMVFRNLHRKFRHYLEGKDVRSFEQLGEFGREFEKRRELDNRYAPSPPKSKARIPAAAYNWESSVNAASITENGELSASQGAT